MGPKKQAQHGHIRRSGIRSSHVADGNLDHLGFLAYLFLDSFCGGSVAWGRPVMGLGYVARDPIRPTEKKRTILNR